MNFETSNMGKTNLKAAVFVAALAVALAALAAFAKAPPAEAHDHRPPQAVLMKGTKELQVGYLRAYCWTYPADGETIRTCRDEGPDWPAVDRVAPGTKLRVRVFKTQRPEAGSFGVLAYPRVDQLGYEAGKARNIPVSLKPVVEGGKTAAWDAIFYVNRPDSHYYLYAGGEWEDAVWGSEMDPQDAWWNFHVKTRA